MSILPLVQLDKENVLSTDTILRKKINLVIDFGEQFQNIVEDLIDTFKSYEIAVGLAAPQVGIDLKLAVLNPNKKENPNDLIIVNPVIISSSGKKEIKKESCMSFPHFRGEVERRDKVNIDFQDRFGKKLNLKASGFLARIIYHEVDHLNGILYVDRMKDIGSIEPVDFFL